MNTCVGMLLPFIILNTCNQVTDLNLLCCLQKCKVKGWGLMTFMMTFVVMKDIPPFLNKKVFTGKLKITTHIIIQTWSSSSPHFVISALTVCCFCYNPEIWREGWAVGGAKTETMLEASLTPLRTFLPAAMSSSSFGRSLGISSLCASRFWVSCLTNIYKIFDLLFQLILFCPSISSSNHLVRFGEHQFSFETNWY